MEASRLSSAAEAVRYACLSGKPTGGMGRRGSGWLCPVHSGSFCSTSLSAFSDTTYARKMSSLAAVEDGVCFCFQRSLTTTREEMFFLFVCLFVFLPRGAPMFQKHPWGGVPFVATLCTGRCHSSPTRNEAKLYLSQYGHQQCTTGVGTRYTQISSCVVPRS